MIICRSIACVFSLNGTPLTYGQQAIQAGEPYAMPCANLESVRWSVWICWVRNGVNQHAELAQYTCTQLRRARRTSTIIVIGTSTSSRVRFAFLLLAFVLWLLVYFAISVFPGFSIAATPARRHIIKHVNLQHHSRFGTPHYLILDVQLAPLSRIISLRSTSNNVAH